MSDENEWEGFKLVSDCINALISNSELFEAFSKYDQEEEDVHSLRITMDIVNTCQRIWMERKVLEPQN
jgi:hypothetical protein